jgi:predicted ribosomally synthesized peptide with SipW-like signal peptide
MADSVESRGPRASIRVRAALAGGLVFGVTAGLTLAAWTDADYVSSSFTASSFGVQMSVNGGTYIPAGPFSAGAAGIYPGSAGTRYVSLKVKTTTGSTAGTVRLSASANPGGGLTPVLRSRIVQVLPAAACSSAAFTAGATYVAGTNTTYQMVSAALAPSTAVAVAANAGSEVAYCIELSIATATVQATYQGTAATATWTVTGQSS